jgi:hypothetical protein
MNLGQKEGYMYFDNEYYFYHVLPLVFMFYNGVIFYLWLRFLFKLKNNSMAWLIKDEKAWFWAMFWTLMLLDSLPAYTFFPIGTIAVFLFYCLIVTAKTSFGSAAHALDRQLEMKRLT